MQQGHDKIKYGLRRDSRAAHAVYVTEIPGSRKWGGNCLIFNTLNKFKIQNYKLINDFAKSLFPKQFVMSA